MGDGQMVTIFIKTQLKKELVTLAIWHSYCLRSTLSAMLQRLQLQLPLNVGQKRPGVVARDFDIDGWL